MYVYNYNEAKAMVKRQKEKYNWEFIFLGANIDAVEVARRFGIDRRRAINYECDSEGTDYNYKMFSKMVSAVRNASNYEEMDVLVDECCDAMMQFHESRNNEEENFGFI